MPAVKNVLTVIGAACLALAAIVIVYLVSGLYNVGADSEHTGAMRWALAFVRERSVDAHGEDIVAPRLDDPKMIAEGAEHYDAMCTGCHLAPGMAENEMRPGMNPKPPILAKFAPDSPGEAFWVIKHGIKMTGMPAWGLTHSDEEIWNIVAFLEKQPKLSAEEYRALVKSAGGHHEHDDSQMKM
jgi:mono/diheme cytochrome c family protein